MFESNLRSGRHTKSRPGLVSVGILLVLAFLAVSLVAFKRGGSPAVLGSTRSSVLMAWTTGNVSPGFAASAANLPQVASVAEVRNGMGWLTSWAANGAAASLPPAGFKIPIEIAAVDPVEYARFVPEASRAAFARLSEGGALLSRSGAALRGIKDTGTLQFGNLTVPVYGVVDDNLVASHEAVMSFQTAARIGIKKAKYILIAPQKGSSEAEINQALRNQVPAGKRLGMRTVDDAAVFRPGGTTLPQVQMKKLFGEFAARLGKGPNLIIDPAWLDANTTDVTFPLLGLTHCNKKVIPAITGALNEIKQKHLEGLVAKNDFGGCFAPKNLTDDPNSGISHHAWGTAIDFNVSENVYGTKPTMDPRLVAIMKRWGFTWGGNWMVPDGMHFEYLQDPKT